MPEKALDMNALFLGALGAIASGVTWLIRKLFVNEKRISLLEQDAEQRRQERAEDKEEMREIRNDIKELIRKP